jgi:ABC-type multidrug transport system fused ATPase/permease subunit
MGSMFSKSTKTESTPQAKPIEPLAVAKTALFETIKKFKLPSLQAFIVSIAPIIPKTIAPFLLKRLVTDIRQLNFESLDEPKQFNNMVYIAIEAMSFVILYNLNRTFKAQHSHFRREFISRVGSHIISTTVNNLSHVSLANMSENNAGKLPSTVNVLANETRELISHFASMMYSSIDLMAATFITPIEMGMTNRLILGGVLLSTFITQFNSAAEQLQNELKLLSSAAHIDTELVERSKNHLIVLHYKSQRFETALLDVLLEENVQLNTKGSRLQLRVAVKRFFINSTALAINLFYSISRYTSRQISDVSDIVLSYQQLDSNIGVSTDISASVIEFYRSWANLSKTVNSLNLTMAKPQTQSTAALIRPLKTHVNERIGFQNVSFGYRSTQVQSESREILKRVNFTIPKNKLTVVIGQTGQGKSSIAKLIAGLYVHQRGVIHTQYPDLSDACTYIPCEPLLFAHRSLFENMLYSLSLSNEDVVPAPTLNLLLHLVKKFNLMTLLKLNPDESDAHIILNALKSKMAKGLSTGEAKRIALIRGLINVKELLILDEPTNGLDAATSQILIRYILELMRDNITLVIITHDLSLAQAYADHVLILNQKSVHEGTHQHLLEHHAGYQELWEQRVDATREPNRYRFHQDEGPVTKSTEYITREEVRLI